MYNNIVTGKRVYAAFMHKLQLPLRQFIVYIIIIRSRLIIRGDHYRQFSVRM